jgi:hypothetical protein
MVEYADHVRQSMKRLYESLSEKDRRRYAAVEANHDSCHPLLETCAAAYLTQGKTKWRSFFTPLRR